MLAASHLKRVDALCRAARRAGFEPRRVLPAVLATLAAYRRFDEDPPGLTAVINLGSRSTSFLFLEKGRFLTRTVLGGTAAPTPGEIAASVGQEWLRTLRHHQRQSGLAEPESLYLAGEGVRLPGVSEAFSGRLGRPLEILDADRVLGQTGSADRSLELIGAAEAHTREGSVAVNLLPASDVQRFASQRRRALVAAACLVASMVALAWTAMRPQRPATRVALAVPPPAAVAVVAAIEPTAPIAAVVPPTEEVAAVAPEPGFELLTVRAEPYRLQLAGYVDGADGARAVLVSEQQPLPVVAGGGLRLDSLGVAVRSVELRQVAVTHGDDWPVVEVAAFATLHDEQTGEDVVLDSRAPRMEPVKAWLRGLGDDEDARGLREGEVVTDAGVAYRVDRIQADPAEVVLVREVDGEPDWEGTVLRPASGGRRKPTGHPRKVAAARD